MSLRECFDRHGCDKGKRHGYERAYEPAFEGVRNEPLRILDIGVFKGASLAAWADYFPNAQIVGIDIFTRVQPEDIEILRHPRVDWHRIDSTKPIDLGHFDIAIDDGLHTFPGQRKTFENFKPSVDRYFIEDVWSLNHMTDKERQHKWLKKDGYSEAEYQELMAAILGYNVTWHDLRKGHQPDSFIIEVT